jgi:hypothetical protein
MSPEGEKRIHDRLAPRHLGGAEVRIDVQGLRIQGHVAVGHVVRLGDRARHSVAEDPADKKAFEVQTAARVPPFGVVHWISSGKGVRLHQLCKCRAARATITSPDDRPPKTVFPRRRVRFLHCSPSKETRHERAASGHPAGVPHPSGQSPFHRRLVAVGAGGESIPTFNPATGQVLATLARGRRPTWMRPSSAPAAPSRVPGAASRPTSATR